MIEHLNTKRDQPNQPKMTSFLKFNQLIFIFFILNQFNQLVSSTILTLKSSNSHLNLNQIIHAPNFNRTELNLSFKYKPSNERFVLISGILDLQSNELNELLKFLLMIDHLERPKLIINKLSKLSNENLIDKYFRLELNETKVYELNLIMNHDSKPGDHVMQFDSDKNENKDKNTIKKLIYNQIHSINEPFRFDSSKLQNSHQIQKSLVQENTTNNDPLNEIVWSSVSVLVGRDQFNIVHLPYSSCSLSTCVQHNLKYKLINKDENYKNNDFKDDESTEDNHQQNEAIKNDEKNDAKISQSIELKQLLIGKEYTDLDSSLNINLIMKHVNRTANKNDAKQLNETEDSHIKSQIHDNVVIRDLHKTNQEYSGLIGCLNEIKLNGQLLNFNKIQSPISSEVISFEANFSSFDRLSPLTNKSNIKSFEKINLKRSDKLNYNENVVKINKKEDNQEFRKKIDRKQDKNLDKEDSEENNDEEINEKNETNENMEQDVKEFLDKENRQDVEKEIEYDDQINLINWWDNVELLNKSLIGKIDFGICNRSDPCKNFCLHNASCTLNEDGEAICHCNNGYTGKRCYFPLYKRNCKELKLLGFQSNGQYIVDSDGIGPYPPSHVFCKFKDKDDTETLIHHNLKDETIVRSDRLTRPFSFKLKYRDFTQEMLVNYMNKFRSCKQAIRYDCHHSKFGFGDHAWFRKLSLNGSLEIVDNKSMNESQNDHSPNKVCSLIEDVWNYEELNISQPIIEAYFLPLFNCLSDHQHCHRNGFWRRLSNKILPNTNLITKNEFKQFKAKAGKRKFRPEARLSIGPLECTGNKHSSYEVAFATEASYIEIYYKNLINFINGSSSQLRNKINNSFSIKHISFNFRTLQTKPGILIHITLQPGDQLFFEIMLKNEHELEFAYPHNDKMKSTKLRSIQRLNTGDWQMIQVFFNDQEMRISVNTISLLFNFDGKPLFDKFNHTIFVGGVARTIGNRKSKIGFIGCFKELSFDDEDRSTINLKEFIHPKLVKQILPTCKRICIKNPCENEGVCREHWTFRRCVCKNKFAHIGFNCELNLNKNSVTIMKGKSFIHLVLNRNFNKFLQNELNEFVNQNTINTLIELNAKQLADKGKLKTDSDSLNLVNVKGVKNLHLSEERRWNELLLMNKNFSENSSNSIQFMIGSQMNDSLNNQTFSRLIHSIEQPAGLGLDKWDSLNKGNLKMTLQLEFRTRVDSGLLFYANDNLNNFIQLHFVDKKRLCLTFNVVDKIMRIEIILDDGILNSGDPIQLRVKRYLEYTVFHVLIYLKEHNKYEQKSIYVKIPCEFLTTYSHKPFKLNNDFDFFYKLESELTYKFVNFEDKTNDKEFERDKEVDHVHIGNKNETNNKNELNLRKHAKPDERFVIDMQDDNSNKSINFKISNSSRTTSINRSSINNIKMTNLIGNSIGNSSTNLLNKQQTINSTNQNKFTEQVIPVRGYYKLQVFPSYFNMIEMTDNAESYDGLINNLDKLIEDENDFFKPLNLIYLANLNNFDSYFGLNKTFNTSTSSLTKNIVQSIATNVLQKNNKTTATNYVPLLTLLNTTISKINLTNSSNDSLQNSIQTTLKNSIEKGLDQNDTQINILQMQLNSTFNNTLSGTTVDTFNLTDLLNKNNISVSKSDKGSDLNTTFSHKNYTQIYIGNVDGNDTLSSLPGFVGTISGVIFNNQLINLTKITEKRYKDELDSGKMLIGIKMLCDLQDCQNSGVCIDDWKTNKTICNCTNTSYTGEKCNEDLGSSFNDNNHLFYRLDARKPRNLLEDQVIFELAFNFNYNEYFNEKNKYYHQETDESVLHKHNKFNSDIDQNSKYKWNFDNQILLLIIYETRYINLYVNKNNALILSDVNNKGDELNLKIENNINNTFFDEYRHYIRYNRKEQTVLLDDKSFKVNLYKDVVKHFYLPNLSNYGIYIAGKPKKDKRFDNWNGFFGSICNVKVILNGQTFEPFNNAFNAVNMSLIKITGSIRQARCAGFNKVESRENSFLPYRKKDLLNQYLKWNTPKPEFIEFYHSLFAQYDDDIFLYSIGFVLLVICILLPISIYILVKTLKIRKKKLLQEAKFSRTKVIFKRKKGKKSKSLDSVYLGEIKNMIR